MGDFIIKPLGMTSAFSEQENKKYHYIENSKGHHLWADVPNAGDYIYFRSHNEIKSPGFGGAKLTFQLVDGGSLILQGPWHSNSTSLYQDTGVDLRDKHLTYGVIGKVYEYVRESNRELIKDVIYKDEDWRIGSFNRITAMVGDLLLSGDYGKLAYYKQSLGGASMGSLTKEEIEKNKDYYYGHLSPQQNESLV